MNNETLLRETAAYFQALEQEAEFAKIPEGTTRRRDGVNQVLKNSRWHNVEPEDSDVKKKNQNTSEMKQFKT